MMERIGEVVAIVFLALFATIHPHAATGAAVGCFFYLAFPGDNTRRQSLLLCVFSFGIGYAFGLFAYGGGPPYDEKAMFAAGSISALAVVIWKGLHRMAAGDGPLPQWIKDILGFLPMFRRKGPDDGN